MSYPHSTATRSRFVVAGAGIAGLVAANHLARDGHDVTLLERASAPGGRAATREKHGFLFNLGPHALYRHGALIRALRTFGIEPHGAVPGANGGFALRGGALHTLPTGFASLVTTGLLGLPAKFEFARILSTIGSLNASVADGETLSEWLERRVRHPEVREVLKMLVRVATFTNDPEHQSARAAIEQLQLAAAGNVLYVDGGWQTLVAALRQRAVDRGARIVTGAAAVALERDGRYVSAVHLADGTRVPADALVATGSPSDIDALAGTAFARQLPPPVRVATLDLGLRSLPKPKRLVAFGVDTPLYFSVHSAVARLAPDGAALLHVAKYLEPGETANGDVERELESMVDRLQPGWREVIAIRQFVPNLTVTHAEVTAAQGGTAGRPSPVLDTYDNVFIAGDWVGARGQLSDAAATSAMEAATAAARAAVKPAARRLTVRPAAAMRA